ncbi:hypothetical protein FQN52_002019 [Onygenales sp. PD_12]|nr:hypothetical protein FQN52_002019 [Onygenales sp. PD_12]
MAPLKASILYLLALTLAATTTLAHPKITRDDYQQCGGLVSDPDACAEGQVCIDDPRDDCDPNNGGADCGGICVEPVFCGGFAGTACEGEGKQCYDDPRDDCDPNNGGADCGGLCI